MFQHIEKAPPDAILGVTAAFRADPAPNKVDLGVGVYKDETGATPIPQAVLKAQSAVMAAETTKAYLGPIGNPAFNTAMAQLVLGDTYGALKDRLALVQTPGGSGALRMAAEIIRLTGDVGMFASDPTWANHGPLLGKLGTYPYYDFTTRAVAFDKMIGAISNLAAGSVVVLHGSCHNPTGCDLTAAQWDEVGAVLKAKRLVPLIDMAYQGLGDGLDADAAPLRKLVTQLPEALVAVSCSKNFGLYRDRVGLLMVISDNAAAVNSQFERLARTLYSMPPDHGAAIVAHLLGDAALRTSWVAEVDAMTARIKELRRLLAGRLGNDFGWIAEGRGMFSLFGFDAGAMERLRAKHIYLAPGGRFNFAGLHPKSVDQVAEALAAEIRR